MLRIISAISLIDVIDILIITTISYRLFLLFKGTKAVYMFFGIILLLFASYFVHSFDLKTTDWLLDNFTASIFLILIIVFQPEIRKALAVIGGPRIMGKNFSKVVETEDYLEEIIKAVAVLANRQIGALIVIENKTELNDHVQAGIQIDSIVSRDVLLSIFIPYSPLHDGAVIISAGKIAYAGTILPLTKKEELDKIFGTRHRAAVGITEETDAICIVVSEERGTISVASNGELNSGLDTEKLRQILKKMHKML